jgi:hypothetical protein
LTHRERPYMAMLLPYSTDLSRRTGWHIFDTKGIVQVKL